MSDLTPITEFDGWCAKREDMGAYTSSAYPSGSKVRQYSGVLAGLAAMGYAGAVLAVAVSPLADGDAIIKNAEKLTDRSLPPFTLVRAPGKYEVWRAERLPDQTVLDPYYAAKALPYIEPGDCLWVPGLRPLASIPKKCREALGEDL